MKEHHKQKHENHQTLHAFLKNTTATIYSLVYVVLWPHVKAHEKPGDDDEFSFFSPS